jgi:hypothetical protein
MKQEMTCFVGNWKPSTCGEHLLHFLVAEVGEFQSIESSAELWLAGIPRSRSFAKFVHGVVVLHAFGRLIQVAKAFRSRHLDDEDTCLSLISGFLLEKMGISHATCQGFEKIPVLALNAARASSKNSHRVPQRNQREVQKEFSGMFCCYSCGGELDPNDRRKLVPDPSDGGKEIKNCRYAEYEHIWPHAFGGNTITSNLAPACQFCNSAKDSEVSWEWGLVQSLIPVTDLDQLTLEDKHLKRSTKISLHMKAAMQYARQNGTTLKDAIRIIGPRESSVAIIDSDDTPDFFNLKVHDVSRTGVHWDA